MWHYNFQDKDGSLRPDFNSEALSRGNEAFKIEKMIDLHRDSQFESMILIQLFVRETPVLAIKLEKRNKLTFNAFTEVRTI